MTAPVPAPATTYADAASGDLVFPDRQPAAGPLRLVARQGQPVPPDLADAINQAVAALDTPRRSRRRTTDEEDS